MKPRISVITLGVKNFERSLRFYRDGLSWPTKAKTEDGIAFFDLHDIILAIFGKNDLARDATVDPDGNGFSGVTLAHNTGSETEVNEIMRRAEEIGAKVVKRPQKTDWGGYGGYFSDPDGYLWEVVYNPNWKLDSDGKVIRW